MGFLRNEKEYCWGYLELPAYLCTMKMSRKLYPNAYRHSLDSLAERFAIPFRDAHRALPDALIAAQALLKMLEHGNIRSVEELRSKAGRKRLVRSA